MRSSVNIKFLSANHRVAALLSVIIIALSGSFNIFSETPSRQRPNRPVRPEPRHSSPVLIAEPADSVLLEPYPQLYDPDSIDSISPREDAELIMPLDSLSLLHTQSLDSPERVYTFNPDPTRAVWMSALFPGLGQLYNRRYWKLPIVIGGFMGLAYATSWNNTMLSDYTTAYGDIMDNDPTTKSYMDFFAPTVNESDLDKSWLTNLLRSRKNYYRRNRDLCILCMVGLYAVAMIDAYVDAQLAHFDISPNLSVDLAPTLIEGDLRGPTSRPGVGLYWAINF